MLCLLIKDRVSKSIVGYKVFSDRSLEKTFWFTDIGFRWNRKASEYVVIYDKYETDRRLGEDFFSNKLMLAYGRRMVLAKAQELTERFGECNITESTNGDVQTLRLTFALTQQVQHYVRR